MRNEVRYKNTTTDFVVVFFMQGTNMFLGRKKREEKFNQDYEKAYALFLQLKMRDCQAMMEPWSKKGFAKASALLCRINRIAYDMVKEGEKKEEFRQKILLYLERGAKQGDSNATFQLGKIYEFPEILNITTDMKKALYYYELASEKEYGPALNNLGCLYHYGKGVMRDFAKAKDLYHRAAVAGEPRGYLSLAYVYMWGKGVPIDLYAAEEYLHMAKTMTEEKKFIAESENNKTEVRRYADILTDAEKCRNYLESEKRSLAYRNEDGKEKENILRNLTGAAQNGDGRAQFELGLYYNDRKDYASAREWFLKAAEKGFSGAVVNLGFQYYHGKGIPKDFEKAYQHFDRAEKMNGNKTAMLMLGKMYEKGEYVKQNFEEAAKWYEKAANQGEASAAGCLAIFYEEGRDGIKQNYEKAALFYQQGVEAGLMFCESRLANLYAIGKGVKKDYNKAIDLFNLAAGKGSEYAKKRLEEVYREKNDALSKD